MDRLSYALAAAGCPAASAHGDHVRIMATGIAARVTPIDGGLSFRATVCGDDLTLDADRINAANLATRFARYSGEDGRLVIACEMLGQADRQLPSHLRMWGLVVENARRLMAELVRFSPLATRGT